MATIYEVKKELLACIKIDDERAVNTETGEIIDIEALNALEMEFNERVEGIGLWIKNEDYLISDIDAEIKKLQARKKVHENKRDSLTSYEAMLLDGKKFETGKLQIGWRKSEVVLISDESKLPAEYIKTKTTITADKVLLKKELKAGKEIEGVTLEIRNNMQIK